MGDWKKDDDDDAILEGILMVVLWLVTSSVIAYSWGSLVMRISAGQDVVGSRDKMIIASMYRSG